jgi:hypothetical protein
MATVKKSESKTVKKHDATVFKPANKQSSETVNRKRKIPKYKSFRLSKKIPHPAGPLPNVRVILNKTLRLIWKNKKPLMGIFVVYAIINLVLVRGFASPLNIAELKQSISDSFGDSINGVSLVGAIFGTLLGTSSSSGSETAAVYQSVLFIVVSLALIWVFRQSAVGSKPTTKAHFIMDFTH